MGKLAINLFGSFQVLLDGVPASAFESDKARALLAYLVVETGHSHRREALAELLWPGHPEERARRNLSQALYSLRTVLGERLPGIAPPSSPPPPSAPPLLLVTPETIQLNPAAGLWLDVAEFTRLVEACDRHAHHRLETCPACQERLEQAAALYQGEFLAGFSLRDSPAYEEWTLVLRERCRQSARRALAILAACHERQEHIVEALQAARRLAELDPYDDEACRQLLRLLVASGQRSEALGRYESFRALLRTDLGLDPQPETADLYRRIRAQRDGEPLQAARRHNLPASLSPLIGREAEMNELQTCLLDPACRLLTVLGPGGSGKSRLALEAARGLLGRFVDGVYLVDLSPLASPQAILPGVAVTIGLRINPLKPPLAQVQDYLRQKELLLLLDGCEGLLEGVPLVLELLSAAPGLKVLATSRARLNAEEEQVYLLGGLECPSPENLEAAAGCAAVRLFASGARWARTGFELDARSLPGVAAICAEAQGMPLAILLAAAWVEVLSPDEILAEMRRSLDFLQAEWAGLPPRQRSVRATFDYSWKLLEAGEQAIFQALCVFRGAFTRQAASQVSGATPAALRRLVDKSFVTPQAGEWHMVHALLRQYGLEKLNALPAASQEAHARYSAYYLEKLEGWEAGLKGARQLETLAELDARINDLRPAWEWSCGQGQIERLSRGLEGLCLYYELRARFVEGKSLCQESAAKLAQGRDLDEQPQTRLLLAHLAVWESRFCRLLGETEPARQRLEESQARLDGLVGFGLDARPIQALIHLEAGEAVFTADLAEAQRRLERSLALYRQIGDSWYVAGALCRLGVNRHHAGDYAGSDRLLSEAIVLYRELGASARVASVQRLVAQNLFRLGKTESALALMRQVIEFSWASGDKAQTMLDARTLALAMLYNGIYEEAHPLFQQALSLAQELGNRYEIAFIHVVFGLYGQMTGQYDLACRHLQMCLELARSDGFQREEATGLWSLGCITLVEKSAWEARPYFQESIARYRQVGHPDELSWALSLDAFCLLGGGEAEQARQRLVEALEITRSIQGYISTLLALAVSAIWLASQGGDNTFGEKALGFFALAARQPVFANSAWFAELFGKSIAARTAGLPAERAEAARARGRQSPLWQTIEELYSILKSVG